MLIILDLIIKYYYNKGKEKFYMELIYMLKEEFIKLGYTE